MWLAGGFFMAWMATENFQSVDRLLNAGNPAAAVRLKVLGNTEARLLLRYQVSEQNRFYFETWEIAQIFLGGFLFFFLLFGTNEGKLTLALALLMFVLLLAQRLALTPEITALGRVIDFRPEAQATGDHAKFMVLHTAYVAIEIAKWGLGIVLALLLIFTHTRRLRDSGKQVDFVNKPDHSHVNR
jgi:hypothetical protein